LTFPKEIITYINQFYVQLEVNYILCNIIGENICPCPEEDCIKNWYKGKENNELSEYWDIIHCCTSNCHVLFYGDNNNNEGFCCRVCERMCCEECRQAYTLICIECDESSSSVSLSDDDNGDIIW